MKLFKDFDTIQNHQTEVVEKIVIQPRSLASELMRTLVVIGAVIVLGYGISYASESTLITNLIEATKQEEKKTISTRGQITVLENSSFTLSNATDREGEAAGLTYTVNIKEDAHIKSKEGDTRSFSDLQVYQDVIVKGVIQGDTITAHTVIILESLTALIEVATTTESVATTTDEFATSTATSTEDTASTTDDTATSTDEGGSGSFVDTVTDAIGDVIDTVTDVLGDIIDGITGTSTDPVVPPTATSTDDTATTTEETTTTPDDTASTTPVEEDSEPTPVEPVVEPAPAEEEPESVPEPEPIPEPEPENNAEPQ